MIHTIISLDDVMGRSDNCEVVTEQIEGGYAEYTCENGRKTLRRLISTNPAMYLDRRYQPTLYFT